MNDSENNTDTLKTLINDAFRLLNAPEIKNRIPGSVPWAQCRDEWNERAAEFVTRKEAGMSDNDPTIGEMNTPKTAEQINAPHMAGIANRVEPITTHMRLMALDEMTKLRSEVASLERDLAANIASMNELSKFSFESIQKLTEQLETQKEVCRVSDEAFNFHLKRANDLTAKLTASELREQKLRESLQFCADFPRNDRVGPIAKEALTLTSDSTALKELIGPVIQTLHRLADHLKRNYVGPASPTPEEVMNAREVCLAEAIRLKAIAEGE